MPEIGVITNPRSRANLANPRLHDRLVDALGDGGILAAPDGLDALAGTLRSWRETGVSTVAVNGGDGSLHRVVTALVRSWGADHLPTLAILPAGTMNIVASSVGVRGRPPAVLKRLVAGPTPTTTVWLLRVTGDGEPVYGFLFGNGIIARFLEVYYEGGDPTPAKAAWILGRGALSAMVGGRFIRRLMRPFPGSLDVDGVRQPESQWTAIAAGTVQQIGLGFKAFYLAPDHPGQLHGIGVASSVVDLARDLPNVYRGRPLARPGNRGFPATKLVIQSEEPIGFMVDGDFHTATDSLTVEVGPSIEVALP